MCDYIFSFVPNIKPICIMYYHKKTDTELYIMINCQIMAFFVINTREDKYDLTLVVLEFGNNLLSD